MCLCYVENIHIEFHDSVPEYAHFVAEATFVKGVVPVQHGGLEPISVNNVTCEGGVMRDAKRGGGCGAPLVFSNNYSYYLNY